MNGEMIFDAIKGMEGTMTGQNAEEDGEMCFGRVTRCGNRNGRKGVLKNGGRSSVSDSSSERLSEAADGCGFQWCVKGLSGLRIRRECMWIDC
jgi:hypothetical protein